MKDVSTLIFVFLPVLPFTHGLLPVGLFAICHSLILPCRLITLAVTRPLGLHSLYRGIIEHVDSPALQCLTQLFGTKSLSRLVEVGNIELKNRLF